MSTTTNAAQCRILRSICTRLDSASSAELPYISSTLSSSLQLCRGLLCCPDDQLAQFAHDAHSLCKRYRDKLSSLLQDKNQARKLAAIKLIKASVHIGGYDVLAKSGHWVRGLISCVNTSWTAARQLAILTVISIFRRIHGLPSLTREIITPILPSFITSCVNSITSKATESGKTQAIRDEGLVITVLSAFVVLLPNHPATFRPFVRQLTSILSLLIAPSVHSDAEADRYRSPKLRACAQSLHALLPRCATKSDGGPGETWLSNVTLIRRQIELTTDEVYRCLHGMRSIETNGTHEQTSSGRSRPNEQPSSEIVDGLHLQKWTGIHAGVMRIVDLTNTLESYLASRGNASYSIRMHQLLAVFERLLAAFPAQHGSDLSSAALHRDFSADEFNSLFTYIQHIQSAVLECLGTLIRRLGPNSMAISHGMLEDLLWRLRGYTESAVLRSSYYKSLQLCVQNIGPSLSTSVVADMRGALEAACSDASSIITIAGSNGLNGSHKRHDVDAYFENTPSSYVAHKSGTFEQASSLVETVIRCVPGYTIPVALRNTIDRTAVLGRNERMMLGSIFNAPYNRVSDPVTASVVPFLAREMPQSMVVEGLLRPRLPVISASRQSRGDSVEAESNEALDSNDGWHSEPLSSVRDTQETILQTAPSPLLQMKPLDDPEETPVRQELSVTDRADPESESRPASETAMDIDPNFASISNSAVPVVNEVMEENSANLTNPRDEENKQHESVRTIKLATYEAAPGPTSVSAIAEVTPKVDVGLENQPIDKTASDSSDDDSPFPEIILDDEDEDDGEE